MPVKIVGATAVLLLSANPRRKRLLIQHQSQNIDANNTGQVFITFGKQPTAIVANPNQGEVLTQGAFIHKKMVDETLTKKHKREIWALSDTASQSLHIEEDIEEEESKEE